MVQVGNKIKIDASGRITIPSEIMKLMDLEKNSDEVYWDISGMRVCLMKVTTKYNGFDFETEEIEQRLRDYEEQYLVNFDSEDIDPEEIERRSREQYLKDKKNREELRKLKSKETS
jgi:bifunctional DNA-binding transcriptional regulator/antitoxin component of YhaV-PrlF toxin-antitoxin module